MHVIIYIYTHYYCRVTGLCYVTHRRSVNDASLCVCRSVRKNSWLRSGEGEGDDNNNNNNNDNSNNISTNNTNNDNDSNNDDDNDNKHMNISLNDQISKQIIRPFFTLRIVGPRIFESTFRNYCARKLDGALRKSTSFV